MFSSPPANPTPASLKTTLDQQLFTFVETMPTCAFELNKMTQDASYRPNNDIMKCLSRKGYVLADGSINPDIAEYAETWLFPVSEERKKALEEKKAEKPKKK